ncbi:MAG: FkbM family methyltransferase [Gemmatimonadaceae bacterium]|nr:FkbM family methyltransferase [Gemmatimonadaceae bacterium]
MRRRGGHHRPLTESLGIGGRIVAIVFLADAPSLHAAGEVPAPDVIKIDVEGAERLVLAGAARLLRERRPVVILSVHSDDLDRDCRATLSGLGYSVTGIDRYVLVAVPEPPAAGSTA